MSWLNNVKNFTAKTITKTRYNCKRNSAEMYLGAGVAGFLLTVYEASKATLSARDILEWHKQVREEAEEARVIAEETGREFDYSRERLIIYSKTFVELAKLYAPTIALGGLSLGCIIVSRNITHRRYLAAVAAYNGLREVFGAYRNRVREEFGEMYDHHFRYGTELREVTEEIIDEKGKKKKVKHMEEVPGTEKVTDNDICIWWDEMLPNGEKNHNWDENPDFCITWLRGQQARVNDLLHCRGYLFLNEVYNALGLPPSKQGSELGWFVDKGHYPSVDFGIYDGMRGSLSSSGRGERFLLKFETDGIITGKLNNWELPFQREQVA